MAPIFWLGSFLPVAQAVETPADRQLSQSPVSRNGNIQQSTDGVDSENRSLSQSSPRLDPSATSLGSNTAIGSPSSLGASAIPGWSPSASSPTSMITHATSPQNHVRSPGFRHPTNSLAAQPLTSAQHQQHQLDDSEVSAIRSPASHLAESDSDDESPQRRRRTAVRRGRRRRYRFIFNPIAFLTILRHLEFDGAERRDVEGAE